MTETDSTRDNEPTEAPEQEAEAKSFDLNERLELDDHTSATVELGGSALKSTIEVPQDDAEIDYYDAFPGLKDLHPSFMEEIKRSRNKKDPISEYFERNPDADRNAIALRWLDGELYEAATVVDHLAQFPDINRKYVGDKLAEKQLSYKIVEHIDEFPEIDKNALIEQLFEQKHESTILHYMDKFPHLNREEFLERILREGKDSFALVWIVSHVDELPSVDRELLATRLSKRNMDFHIALSIDKFPNLDRKKLISRLFALNQQMFILDKYEQFAPYLSKRERYKLARIRRKQKG